MKLRADVMWRIGEAGGVPLDARLLDLLRALGRHATLRAAATETGISYRAAWGLLLDAKALVGAPLAELQRGRGARLTRLGTSLLQADERLRRETEPLRARFEVATDGSASLAAVPLRLAASHDPLLAEFCERLAIPTGLLSEVTFRGSSESLALYARGAVDIAGFHVTIGGDGDGLRRTLRAARDRLVRFVDREQGLIVAHGNPLKLASVADIARQRARFVNRQRGSGTRLIVDRLLAEQGLAPDRIRGYGTEEYTHLAVAATIAAGRADAGIGVRAAAAQLDLGFVPVLRERYWLVMRERTLVTAAAQRLVSVLREKAFTRLARKFVGYSFEHAGDLSTVEEVDE
jgi:putative molybdopterin biosynthesis protein